MRVSKTVALSTLTALLVGRRRPGPRPSSCKVGYVRSAARAERIGSRQEAEGTLQGAGRQAAGRSRRRRRMQLGRAQGAAREEVVGDEGGGSAQHAEGLRTQAARLRAQLQGLAGPSCSRRTTSSPSSCSKSCRWSSRSSARRAATASSSSSRAAACCTARPISTSPSRSSPATTRGRSSAAPRRDPAAARATAAGASRLHRRTAG